MFDVGFWELVVIGVVGLLVIGPKRLPEVARQLGQWTGKARSMARILKQQLREELGDADPRRIMDPSPVSRAPSAMAGDGSRADEANTAPSDAASSATQAATAPPRADPPA